MRKLHLQFYLAILAALAVFLLASALFWGLAGNWRGDAWGVSAAAQLAQGLLPPAATPPMQQKQWLEDLRQRLRMDFALYDRAGQLLVANENIPRLARRKLAQPGWTWTRSGPVWILPLDDGRRLVVRHPHPPQHVGMRAFIVPLSIVLAFALGAYPIARRLTGRLARLQVGVEQLGQGDLATRVLVEGRDEVAVLARSFNQSAQRIEELVKSHKLLLANCSHELRTPLARIRLGIERLANGPDSTTRDELTRSIVELDALIEEMLLTSRLGALKTLERAEDLDLLALAAEEAAYFDHSVDGSPVTVRGDAGLLRRMTRNLLDNARRHGGGATRIQVGAQAGGTAQLIVEDGGQGGQGIAEADGEKIFEPFYRAAGARSAVRGFGLGLAIVRQIARAHGGDVSYAPLASGGSRFTVTLSNSP